MPDYADVALRAVSKLHDGQTISAREAWKNAAAEVFPTSASMQSKGCPRTTFLTLCAIGAVKGVATSGTVQNSENARHAQDCLTLVTKHPEYVTMAPLHLWKLVTHSSGKAYNQQIHVILGLAQAGLLRYDRHA